MSPPLQRLRTDPSPIPPFPSWAHQALCQLSASPLSSKRLRPLPQAHPGPPTPGQLLEDRGVPPPTPHPTQATG